METSIALIIIAVLAVVAFAVVPMLENILSPKVEVYYTVWVGGGEINDYLTPKLETAINVAREWANAGYDDVIVETIVLLNGKEFRFRENSRDNMSVQVTEW